MKPPVPTSEPVDGAEPDGPTAGEAWTREQLEALLEARFSPGAVARFLAASSARGARTRRERPGLARQAHAWLAFGGLAWIAPAAAGSATFHRTLPSGLAWWGATAAMLRWHLGMVETADGRPRGLGAADAATLTRAWLVPLAAHSPTVGVCAFAAATDVLDGVLARRAEPTRAGRDLEGLVDTCFAVAALRGLRRDGRLGRGPALAETGRLICGTGFATYAYFGRARPPEPALLHAARSATAARCTGLLVAAAGRRRLGGAVLVAGSLASVALSVRGARRVSAQPRR